MKTGIYLKMVVSILTIITAIIGVINFLETQQEKNEQEIHLLLDVAEEYYYAENYEGLAAIYSDERLQNNPNVLLNIGVMYTKGIYYLPDEEQAIRYFELALENGEKEYSIVYLLQLLEYEDIDRIIELVDIGCKNDSRFCERLIQELYFDLGITCTEGYLSDYMQRTEEEKEEIISNMFSFAECYTYEEVTEYTYTADVTTIGEQKVYSNIKAYPASVEERKIDIYIKRYFGTSTIQMVFE